LDSLALVAPDIGCGPDHTGQPVEVGGEERKTCGHPHPIPLAVSTDEVEVTAEDVGERRSRIEGAFLNPVRTSGGTEVHRTSAKQQVIDIALKVDDEFVEILELGIVSPQDAVQEAGVGQGRTCRFPAASS